MVSLAEANATVSHGDHRNQPFRNCWKCFKAPGVEPGVLINQEHAIDYALAAPAFVLVRFGFWIQPATSNALLRLHINGKNWLQHLGSKVCISPDREPTVNLSAPHGRPVQRAMDTATFRVSRRITSVSLSANMEVSGIVFDADASAFTITAGPEFALTISGVGITGGVTEFLEDSTGGTARVEVFGNGRLEILGHHAPGVTIGSIEGGGFVLLGGNNLTVGSNNLSTTFFGKIQESLPKRADLPRAEGGSLTKIGNGKLTLSQASTYTGGTTVGEGELRQRAYREGYS